VFLASLLLEGLLIREALRGEADHFWEQRAAPADFPLPETLNLTGYMDDVPAPLRAFGPGYHDWRNGSIEHLVHVSEVNGQRLYLAFDRSNVGRLAIYYGLAPLALVLLVLYLSTWLGYRASQRALSPLLGLAREVRQLDLKAPDLARYAQRMNDFVDRERHFTRDASHELRSPLTVIRASVEILQRDAPLDRQAQRAVARIQRAARDIEELTSAFLLLAREDETGLPTEPVNINKVVASELERARPLAEGRPVELEVDARCNLVLLAPEKVVSVLVGNLLRNAVAYTEQGSVRVRIDADGIVIADTGVGMPTERMQELYRPFVRGESRRPGFGVGLTIVRRISDRFGWPVDFHSEPGRGTHVRVRFPAAFTVPPA